MNQAQADRVREMEAITPAEMRKKIFDMAWPATVESVLQMMIGMVTSAFIGQIGTIAIGAAGLGRRITHLVWAIFAAIGTGSTVMVARSIGAGNQKAANRYADQAMILTMGIIVVFTGVLILFPEWLIRTLYGSEGELLVSATLYLRITALGVPFMSIMQVCGALMRGAGNTKVPMTVATTINIVNVVLSYPLIFGKFGIPALGLVGAAWALVISRTALRYPSCGITGPMFPITGSMMRAAISLFLERSISSASGSLYGTCRVWATRSGSTPAESGTPIVVAPEPAFTSTASCAP